MSKLVWKILKKVRQRTSMKYATDWRKNIEMQQYKIRTNELAEQDLENAGDYIAFEQLNPIAAEKIVKGIRE